MHTYEDYRKKGMSPAEARRACIDDEKKMGKGGYYNEQGEHDPRGNPMEKYKQNLHVMGNKVYSYHTHVANIEGGKLKVLGYWSPTTSKHVNYVAREMGLDVVHEKDDEKGKGAGGLNPAAYRGNGQGKGGFSDFFSNLFKPKTEKKPEPKTTGTLAEHINQRNKDLRSLGY